MKIKPDINHIHVTVILNGPDTSDKLVTSDISGPDIPLTK
jgi:hypothetical protein